MLTRQSFLAASSAFAAIPLLGTASQQQVLEPRFAPEVVQQDLDAIWSALLDVGADPFRTSVRADVEARYRAVRASIAAPMTVREAWLAIAPVLGALNDGHVDLAFPESMASVSRRFPLRFSIADDEALLVAADHTSTIPIGSRIVSVDDVSAEHYRTVTLSAYGAQTRALHRARVTMSGAGSAYALFGHKPRYRVRWTTPTGTSHEADIASALPQDQTPSANSNDPDPYRYRSLQHGPVGFIDYRSCEDLARFKQFLDDTCRKIQSAPIRALVIDIRKNGGGDSRLNNLLWCYVGSKPFRQFGGVIKKSCDRLKREYGHDLYVNIYGDDAWRAPNGTVLKSGTDPNADLIMPGPLALRFTGPVYLLISAATFSSAMSCASAAKDYGLATIVGEETGEPVISTGEIYTETTPGIGFRAYLTTKVFLPPKPHPDGQGVVPDVAVATTPADISAGRDPVLECVLAMIARTV